MLPEFLTNMSQTTLIALAVVVALLVAAGGVYWWWSRTKVRVQPAPVESTPAVETQVSEAEPAAVPVPAHNDEIGVVNCPDCNEPMVVASEDKTVRKCLRCNQVYEVTAE